LPAQSDSIGICHFPQLFDPNRKRDNEYSGSDTIGPGSRETRPNRT